MKGKARAFNGDGVRNFESFEEENATSLKKFVILFAFQSLQILSSPLKVLKKVDGWNSNSEMHIDIEYQ